MGSMVISSHINFSDSAARARYSPSLLSIYLSILALICRDLQNSYCFAYE